MTLFSKIINGDIPSYTIAESEKFYAFLDIFPLQKGHTLIVPKIEVDKIFELPDAYLSELLLFAKPIAAAIEKNQKFEYYEELGKIARRDYPETLLGNYYLGRFYEETGEPKKAMRTYKSAYILEEIGGYTKDEMLERADAIKRDFGF